MFGVGVVSDEEGMGMGLGLGLGLGLGRGERGVWLKVGDWRVKVHNDVIGIGLWRGVGDRDVHYGVGSKRDRKGYGKWKTYAARMGWGTVMNHNLVRHAC